ncbi:MAG: CPBP family intramembrane glutamic endopeptidase [Promethearchaeia archaeon]
MNLGVNSWILIGLTLLEVLFVIIPPLISARIENHTFREELRNMGLRLARNPLMIRLRRIGLGLLGGLLFYLISGYITNFFRNFIVEQLFGTEYIVRAEENVINTSPVTPTLMQIIILIIMQVFVVGICEEAFFRGFMLSKLEDKLPSGVGIILSSLIFAIYHVPPFIVPLSTIITFFGYYFSFGVLLSLVFKFSDNSLLPGIVAHSFFNILLILV